MEYIEKTSDMIYNTAKECKIFNPMLAASIYASVIYKNRGRGSSGGSDVFRILDPNAGWGDRMIGAMVASKATGVTVEYVGVDPNQDLEESHAKIVSRLGSTVGISAESSFKVIPLTFEDAELFDGFDFSMTSPPLYKSEEGGKKYANYEDWLAQYYIPFLKKTHDAVRIGGMIGIFIDTTVSRSSVRAEQQRMLEITNEFFTEQGSVTVAKIGIRVDDEASASAAVAAASASSRSKKPRAAAAAIISWVYLWERGNNPIDVVVAASLAPPMDLAMYQ